MFESDFAKTDYIEKDNVVFHIWKKEAHFDDYRKPVMASLEMLRAHKNSIFIVDARNGFEDVKEDVEWGFDWFLPELKKTGCKIWGFILPKVSDIEGEIDLWTREVEKNFCVIRAESYEEILALSKREHEVTLVPLTEEDREQFITDNQEAFNYGALEEFGRRDDHFEEDGQIISRETIEQSIDGGEAYRIMCDGKPSGGVVIRVKEDRGDLDLLFVSPKAHSKGIGYKAWCAVEKLHPEVTLWETVTPYFEKRNIHFYVNRCGFHIVEFFNTHHPDPNDPDAEKGEPDDQFPEGMFRFEKRMTH